MAIGTLETERDLEAFILEVLDRGGISGKLTSLTATDVGLQESVQAIVEGGVGPSGAAGGVLSGEYPNPGFAVDMATQAELDEEAAQRKVADSAHAAQTVEVHGISDTTQLALKTEVATDEELVAAVAAEAAARKAADEKRVVGPGVAKDGWLAAFDGTSGKLIKEAGKIIAEQIEAGTITANEIAAKTITAEQIAAGTITSAEIAAGSITGGDIAAGTVTAANITIANLAALSADLGAITAGTVTGATLRTAAAGSRVVIDAAGLHAFDGVEAVLDFDIATGDLVLKGEVKPGSTIPASTVTGELTDAQLKEIAAAKITGQVSGAQIAANSIESGHIVAGTIVAGDIAAGTITATEIKNATITATQIAAGTITSAEIKAGTILGEDIAATTITGANIAANTIAASKLAVAELSAITANLGTVTAGTLKAVSLEGATGSFSGRVDIAAATENLPGVNNQLRWVSGATTISSLWSYTAESNKTKAISISADTAEANPAWFEARVDNANARRYSRIATVHASFKVQESLTGSAPKAIAQIVDSKGAVLERQIYDETGASDFLQLATAAAKNRIAYGITAAIAPGATVEVTHGLGVAKAEDVLFIAFPFVSGGGADYKATGFGRTATKLTIRNSSAAGSGNCAFFWIAIGLS